MDGGETIFKQKYDESNQAVSNDQILYRTPPTNVTVYSGITTERKIWEFEQLSVDSNPFDVARSLHNVPPPLCSTWQDNPVFLSILLTVDTTRKDLNSGRICSRPFLSLARRALSMGKCQ